MFLGINMIMVNVLEFFFITNSAGTIWDNTKVNIPFFSFCALEKQRLLLDLLNICNITMILMKRTEFLTGRTEMLDLLLLFHEMDRVVQVDTIPLTLFAQKLNLWNEESISLLFNSQVIIMIDWVDDISYCLRTASEFKYSCSL